jgi:hypothetical protein
MFRTEWKESQSRLVEMGILIEIRNAECAVCILRDLGVDPCKRFGGVAARIFISMTNFVIVRMRAAMGPALS